MLAPRILHFSKHQIFWDCTAMSACESLPSGLPLPLDQQSATDRHWRSRLQGSTRGSILLSGEDDDSLEDFWKLTVEDYTSLDLTNQGDKQLAIWGVAKRIRDTLDEEYVAGMWEDTLEEQLGWRVADCKVAERPQRLADVPTWSWTSMKGTILVSGRVQSQERCYRVTDHAGKPLAFKLKDDSSRPRLPRQTSDNAEDMGKQLHLADDRRRKSSATSRQNSHPDPSIPQRDVQNGLSFIDSGTRLGQRTDLPSRENSESGYGKPRKESAIRHDSLSNAEDRRDKEPELKDSRIAVQGYLHKGLLKKHDDGTRWLLGMASPPDEQLGQFEAEAFPDVQPRLDEEAVIFLVLVLTQHSDQAKKRYRIGTDPSTQRIWYEGKGIMLRCSNQAENSYQRVGALSIRHLSPQWWNWLRGLTEADAEVEGQSTKLFLL
jgi:hypothetical protein